MKTGRIFMIIVFISVMFVGCSGKVPIEKESESVSTETEKANPAPYIPKIINPEVESVNAFDLTTLRRGSFSYINRDGNLLISNITDENEQMIIYDGFVYDYDFNYKENKIAYIVGRDREDFIHTNAVIYDIDSNQRNVIVANTGIKSVGWSPSGKYLALTQGAGPGNGLVRIYDIKSKAWLKVPYKKGNGFQALSFKWNPSMDILALEILYYPEPGSPVDSGESFGISVYFPEKSNSIKTIVEGTGDYGYDKFQWIDNKTLSMRKWDYKANNMEYYKANIDDGSIVKIPENEIDPVFEKIPKEAYLFDRSLSSDTKLLLYSYGGGSLVPKGKIYLWDIEKQTKSLICHGRLPKWIENNTAKAERKAS
jgi:WD40 repeat protein